MFSVDHFCYSTILKQNSTRESHEIYLTEGTSTKVNIYRILLSSV